jgi:hypothetical protein
MWRRNFKTFLRDVGPRPSGRHSLDRIDNDGPYAPGNVRWATPREQGRNQERCGGLLIPTTADTYHLQPMDSWALVLPHDISPRHGRRYLTNPWLIPAGENGTDVLKVYAIYTVTGAPGDRLVVLWNRADHYVDYEGIPITQGDQRGWGLQVAYVQSGVVTQGVHVNPHYRIFVEQAGIRPTPGLVRRANLCDYDLACGVARRFARYFASVVSAKASYGATAKGRRSIAAFSTAADAEFMASVARAFPDMPLEEHLAMAKIVEARIEARMAAVTDALMRRGLLTETELRAVTAAEAKAAAADVATTGGV